LVSSWASGEDASEYLVLIIVSRPPNTVEKQQIKLFNRVSHSYFLVIADDNTPGDEKACHASGKTFVAAFAVLWFVAPFDATVSLAVRFADVVHTL
jgi:hypothetical protein